MNLFDSLLRKVASYLANYGNRPGNERETAEAFEAYDRLVQDIRRGAGAEELARNKLFHQRGKNSGARVA